MAGKKVKVEYSDDTKLAILTAQLCQDKLAKDVFVLDLKKIDSGPADYFVICSCESSPQVESISDLISRTSKNYHLNKPNIEGLDSLEWVILDYFDVVVHIMLTPVRELYKLEKLWGDADFYSVTDDAELISVKYEDVQRIYN